MRKRVYIVLAAMLLTVVGLAAWQRLRTREPVYQGKRLSEWLREAIDNQSGDGLQFPETEPAAMDAVRAIGTNGLPALIRMMEAKDSPLKRTLVELAYFARTPSLIRLCPPMAYDLQRMGAFGLSALGTNASPAVPPLKNLLVKRRSFPALNALLFIGRDGVVALSQALTNQVTFPASKPPDLRRSIIWAFPYYVATMRGDNIPVPQESIFLGRKYGVPKRPNPVTNVDNLARLKLEVEIMLPSLLQCLNDPDAMVRLSAARALIIIRCGQDKAIPVLVEGLADRNPFIRLEGALYLGSVGSAATSAVPALVKALRTGDLSVRFEVENALIHIDPVAAAKAGVNTNAPGL
jgi:hypothetical protein